MTKRLLRRESCKRGSTVNPAVMKTRTGFVASGGARRASRRTRRCLGPDVRTAGTLRASVTSPAIGPNKRTDGMRRVGNTTISQNAFDDPVKRRLGTILNRCDGGQPTAPVVSRVSGHPWSPVSCIFPRVLDSRARIGENATKPWKTRHFVRSRTDLPNFLGKVVLSRWGLEALILEPAILESLGAEIALAATATRIRVETHTFSGTTNGLR